MSSPNTEKHDEINDADRHVHPELLPGLQLFHQFGGLVLGPTTLQAARAQLEASAMPALDTPRVEERLIPGAQGAPAVRVFVIGAQRDAAKPAVLHLHGGGYVCGSAASNVRLCQELALALDCVVVTVDYRLAPETPFPGSLEDNYAALRWLYANAPALGVDRTRIALKGESAGGGHAAALAIAARTRGEVPIVMQVLIYPMLDDRTGSTHSLPPHLGRHVWTPEHNRFGWRALLGDEAGAVAPPPGAVPARVMDLKGLPPTFIGVGAIDLFVDEDIEYARRLVAAGVPTELVVVPGAYHAFDFFGAQSSIAQQFNQTWMAALRRGFA